MLQTISLANKYPEFDYPSWANWLAQDQDGTWWAYEVEPLQFHKGWYENEVGRYHKLKEEKPALNWREQLFRVS
jgi:hypothetical protein